MRLLAIVNRIDMGGDTSSVLATPGEGRFVYGVLDNLGNPLQFTVIFEYDLSSSMDTLAWASAWHALSNIPFGPAYNTALQGVTDLFVLAGAEPGNPNQGAAIDHVRTNEIALAAPWELRSFQLTDRGTGFNNFDLLQERLEQTPADGFNLSLDLDAWQVANETAILDLEHTVPQGFPSGVYALAGASTAPFTWNNGGTAGPLDPMARHLFGFSTCNGCHTTETGGTPFVHVGPRPLGVMAPLSNFLNQTTGPGVGGFPSGFQTFPDPVVPTLIHDYNEAWRRKCEVARALSGDGKPFTKANGAH